MFRPYLLKQIAKSLYLSIQKGDFPHLFNDGEHDNYQEYFPDISYYSPGNLKSEEVKHDLE